MKIKISQEHVDAVFEDAVHNYPREFCYFAVARETNGKEEIKRLSGYSEGGENFVDPVVSFKKSELDTVFSKIDSLEDIKKIILTKFFKECILEEGEKPIYIHSHTKISPHPSINDAKFLDKYPAIGIIYVEKADNKFKGSLSFYQKDKLFLLKWLFGLSPNKCLIELDGKEYYEISMEKKL